MWRDISSAPRDGSFVDLWMSGPNSPDGYRQTDCWFQIGQWWKDYGDRGDMEPGLMVGDVPTHWCREPSPPVLGE